jgi:hypothetical protein
LRDGAPNAPVETDVCILGAGPVGLALACTLASQGKTVSLVDAGGATAQIASQAPDVHFDRRPYRGATIGRALGLGGTSTLWGGQLLPVRTADMLARPQIQAGAWPIGYHDVEPYFTQVQHLLGVNSAGFDLASIGGAAPALSSLDFTEWSPRLSKWLAFRKRNLAVALASHFDRRSSIQVWVNATVLGWNLSDYGGQTVRELIAQGSGGETLRLHPRAVVIAGGALEAARSVLELKGYAGALSTGVDEFTGRFLHDHLSLRIARVQVVDEARFEERFSPFFEGPIMRSLRMELPPDTLEREGLPALYAHFIAEAPLGSGFAVLRDCLRSAQRRDLTLAVASSRRIPAALPDIGRVLYKRLVKGRLAFPTKSEFFLHIDLEQAPNCNNRVYLGASPTGVRRPMRIDWDVEEDASRIAYRVRQHFERFWSRNALQSVATLDFLDLGDRSQAWNNNVHDLYHPAGTTRMAVDPGLGVVDENLRIHGTSNAYVAGSSVFPSMGAANPTFTAMALAMRLAHFIGQTH